MGVFFLDVVSLLTASALQKGRYHSTTVNLFVLLCFIIFDCLFFFFCLFVVAYIF